MFEYKNMNPFPVVIPTKGGCGKTFRVGEARKDPWFSKFLGYRQLTKVPISPNSDNKSKTSTVDVSKIKDVLSKIQEDAEHYLKKGGIYICKHCEERFDDRIWNVHLFNFCPECGKKWEEE